MRRTCPRCECLSPATAEFCVACGYKIVAFLAEDKPAAPLPPTPPRRSNASAKPLGACVYCGAPARTNVCAQHMDLT